MFNFRVSSFTYSPFVFQPEVPPELTAIVMPGSETGFTEGPYGKILFQKSDFKDFSVHYNIYQIKEDLALDFRWQPGNMQIHAALKNDCHWFIEGLGDLFLAEGQFNIMDGDNIGGTRYLEGGNEYRSVHVVYTPEMLDSVLPAFPAMEEWLANHTAEPRALFNTHPLLTAPLKDIIDRVIHCPYPDDLRQHFLEIKVRELLFLSFIPMGQEATPSVRLTRQNIEMIHETKNILEKNYDQHITITSVARQVGINEFKLKAGFKKLFGMSMFDYLVQTRMLMARDLLLETDKPIKEIALLTGYSTKQSFLNAFKKYFHDTPGSLRKN